VVGLLNGDGLPNTGMPEKIRTKIIGITGGIGSGKTTVGGMLSDRGYVVYDTDEIARELTASGSPVLDEIVKEFGEEILEDGGSLDRSKMSDLVFTDNDKLRLLERILHPRIGEEYRRRAAESGEEWVFVLIPLLFEAGVQRNVDRIWLCYAPGDIRIERVMERDGVEREDILRRMQYQVPDEEKREDSHFIIDTSGSLDDTERQLIEGLAELET
jgi:dephospho-CoA kinase